MKVNEIVNVIEMVSNFIEEGILNSEEFVFDMIIWENVFDLMSNV